MPFSVAEGCSESCCGHRTGVFQRLLLRIQARGLGLLPAPRWRLRSAPAARAPATGPHIINFHSFQLVLQDIFCGCRRGQWSGRGKRNSGTSGRCRCCVHRRLSSTAALSTVQFAGENIIGAGSVRVRLWQLRSNMFCALFHKSLSMMAGIAPSMRTSNFY